MRAEKRKREWELKRGRESESWKEEERVSMKRGRKNKSWKVVERVTAEKRKREWELNWGRESDSWKRGRESERWKEEERVRDRMIILLMEWSIPLRYSRYIMISYCIVFCCFLWTGMDEGEDQVAVGEFLPGRNRWGYVHCGLYHVWCSAYQWFVSIDALL